MSISTSLPSLSMISAAPRAPALRFGVVLRGDEGVEWLLKRNCSISPRQLLAVFAALCALSFGIAGFCWVHGATLVMPFAWIEMLAMGTALWVYGRHAGDRERIECRCGRVTVELTQGMKVERVDLGSGWVGVEPRAGDASLIELSARGVRVAVGRHTRPELRPLLAKELRDVLRGRHALA